MSRILHEAFAVAVTAVILTPAAAALAVTPGTPVIQFGFNPTPASIQVSGAAVYLKTSIYPAPGQIVFFPGAPSIVLRDPVPGRVSVLVKTAGVGIVVSQSTVELVVAQLHS